MSRLLAGVYDPRGRGDRTRLEHIEPKATAHNLDLGSLQVAFTGPRPRRVEPLCLLDGSLDNAAELSAALQAPPSEAPEQLLAAGWQRWGSDLLPRLRGDFALLVWDSERCEGLLARDQLGVRSLFLHESSGIISFATEVRYLLQLLPRRPGPDSVSLAHLLVMSSRPGSATLYAGVRRLNPGAVLLLGPAGVREEVYWAPRYVEPLSEDEPQLSDQVRACLDRAVRRRITADGPTGLLMSGGLDSSSIAAVASTLAPGRILAYAGRFPDHPAVDESTLIERLRSELRLPGSTAVVRPGGMLASAVDHLRAWELPLLDWGSFWMLPLLRAARSHGVTLMLGGDGGDELFGARAYLLADRIRSGHPLQALRLAGELPGAAYGPPRREVVKMLWQMGFAGAAPYRADELLRHRFAGAQRPGWLRPQTRRELLDSDDPFAWKRLDGPRWWASVAHGLTREFDEIGVFENNRLMMAPAGLEARHPLMDLDLVELGLRQPPRATFDSRRSRPVLRSAMAGLLPDDVRLRPQKARFDSLLVDSLAGPDSAAVRALLADPKAELGSYIDLAAMRSDLLDSGSYRREQPFRWMWQVWRLATAECWLRAQADPLASVLPAGVSACATDLVLEHTDAGSATSYFFPP